MHLLRPNILVNALVRLLLLLLLAGGDGFGAETNQGSLQAGMAEIDITPSAGYRMAGYYDERFATGTHDPLKAKALVLRQGDEQIALVGCDLLGLSLNVSTNARALASRATGIPFTNIVIFATHSHTGPLFDDVRRDYFHQLALAKSGEDPQEKVDYPPFLVERLVEVIRQAQGKLASAEVCAGIATQENLSFNRRYLMKNGRVVTNPGQLNTNIVAPAGPIDTEVGILFVKQERNALTISSPSPPSDGGEGEESSRRQLRPVGGLTVFAMHADTLGGTEFSADYPYYLQQTLRGAFGPDYVSVFGAGTCGDINHVNVNKREPYKGPAVTEQLGVTLGRTVLAAIKGLKPIEHPSLAGRSRRVPLPFQRVESKDLVAARTNMARMSDPAFDFLTKVRTVKALDLERRGPTYSAEAQVFRLDADTAIVCLPCELFVELGLAIKRASPFQRTLVISICNDRPGYLPTRQAFRAGSYEIENSRLAPGGGEKLVETALELLNELRR